MDLAQSTASLASAGPVHPPRTSPHLRRCCRRRGPLLSRSDSIAVRFSGRPRLLGMPNAKWVHPDFSDLKERGEPASTEHILFRSQPNPDVLHTKQPHKRVQPNLTHSNPQPNTRASPLVSNSQPISIFHSLCHRRVGPTLVVLHLPLAAAGQLPKF
jgi:hypothetical protein